MSSPQKDQVFSLEVFLDPALLLNNRGGGYALEGVPPAWLVPQLCPFVEHKDLATVMYALVAWAAFTLLV